MIKGKMYCNNKNIKYKVVMQKNCFGNLRVVVKTKLGRFALFCDELTLDKLEYNIRIDSSHEEEELFEIKRSEFLNKWNNYTSKQIKNIVEEFIRNEMDKDKLEYDKDWKVRKLICDFNYKGNYYENQIPKAPKIPMPECKPCRTTIKFDNVKEINNENADMKLIKAKLEYIDSMLNIMLEDVKNSNNTIIQNNKIEKENK
jgi:hypothetical protein